MKSWFLLLFLSTGDTVAIQQPDEDTCLRQLNQFVYVESEEGEEVLVTDKSCEEGEA